MTLLYVAIQLIAQGVLGSSLNHSIAPLADVMAHVDPRLRALMLAGTAFALLGMIASDVLGTPRMLFAFARDGLLPRALGRVHPRTHTLNVAILSYAALAMILALSGSFAELAVLATLVTAGLYVAGCLSAWLLARRGAALAGAALNFRWLGAAALVGAGSMLSLIALGSSTEILGLAALIAVSALIYLPQRWIVVASRQT